MVWAVFFLQAEDGIRYYKVTGVQTWLFRSEGRVERFLAHGLCEERDGAGLQAFALLLHAGDDVERQVSGRGITLQAIEHLKSSHARHFDVVG